MKKLMDLTVDDFNDLVIDLFDTLRKKSILMSEDKKENQIVRASEVEKWLNISHSTLYRWIKSGKLEPPYKIGERYVGWRKEDIEDFINKNKKKN